MEPRIAVFRMDTRWIVSWVSWVQSLTLYKLQMYFNIRGLSPVWARNSSVDTVMGLGLHDLILFPVGARDLFLLHSVQTGSSVHSGYLMNTGGRS